MGDKNPSIIHTRANYTVVWFLGVMLDASYTPVTSFSIHKIVYAFVWQINCLWQNLAGSICSRFVLTSSSWLASLTRAVYSFSFFLITNFFPVITPCNYWNVSPSFSAYHTQTRLSMIGFTRALKWSIFMHKFIWTKVTPRRTLMFSGSPRVKSALFGRSNQ